MRERITALKLKAYLEANLSLMPGGVKVGESANKDIIVTRTD